MKVRRFLKRGLSLLMAVTMILMSVPFVAGADTVLLHYTSVTDPATVNDWRAFFGPTAADTTYAGSVWTDKSVFSDTASYLGATDETEDQEAQDALSLLDPSNFLVALSAIAASKSVEGYSVLPTDTMLVLDLSASMVSNQAVAATVSAANDAIKRLQELSAYNRVGVIAYSGSNNTNSYATTGTAEVILPLGRYTPGQNSQRESVYLVANWTEDNRNRTGVKVAPGVIGTVAEDINSSFSVNNSKLAEGGTYIQNGLYQAWEQFEAVKETAITEGLQAGVERTPVMVLLSDGAPTTATTSFADVGRANSGNGSSDYATPGIAFLTQLTASWVREKLEEKYGTAPLFYTLGLKVDNSDAAKSVLDPANNTATDGMWTTYGNLANQSNKTMQVEIRSASRGTPATTRDVTYVEAPLGRGWKENYVTNYFAAENANGLVRAFESIVEQIVIQSLYYPTLVETGSSINEAGFLEFEDYIGKNMEVKAIKGIQLGSKLYTGATLAKMIYEGGMGTEENPTEAGNNLVWSVQQRLKIADVQTARDLIGDAYSAGQLYYNPETQEFSNYIGWYADANESFLGFWDGKEDSPSAVPVSIADRAVYAIKSYGYYDAIGADDDHRKTDMMYATIQVRTTLKDEADGKIDAGKVGDVRVIGRLPAALIPLVQYDIQLEGTDPLNPASMTIGGATAPSRLIYEVGLSSEIDLLDLEGTAPDSLEKEGDQYVFYTNQWDMTAYGDYSYGTNKNTISFFEPSLENERYYYNADTPIYTDTNGTLYKGDATPVYDANNPYYHRFLTYRGEGQNVQAVYEYEPVSQYVLEHESTDMARLSDGSWVVLRGTIYHHYGDYIRTKTENKTNTAPVSDQPFVHEPAVGAHPTKAKYHVDSFLGNNGKLLVDAYEGIKISKTADSTIEDRQAEYTFEVDAADAAFAETVTLIKEDASGERLLTTLQFAGGKATVTLKSGEIAYVLGQALIGKTLTVSEVIPAGAGYELLSVNGDPQADSAVVSVASGVIGEASFVNTKVYRGEVVITKTVVSNIASHTTKEFNFNITLSGVSTNEPILATRSDGQTYSLIAGQTNTVSLAHNQTLHIEDLPAGMIVFAEEEDYSSIGFTANSLAGSATVAEGETHYIHFVNSYHAASTVPPTNVSVDVHKNLLAQAPWATPVTFEFQLQRFNKEAGKYEEVSGGTGTLTYDNEVGAKNNALADVMKNETYDEAGSYSYRVVEKINSSYEAGGMIYDGTPAYFTVIVSDNEMGQLYVSDVVAGSEAQVNITTGTRTLWNVDTFFENRYEVSGAAEVVVKVGKTVASDAGANILPSGFRFALYDSDANYTLGNLSKEFVATGADGKTELSLLFNDVQEIGTKYYVLKEVVPQNADARIGYSQKSYGLKVVIGHAGGYFTVAAEVYDLSGNTPVLVTSATDAGNSGKRLAVAALEAVPFENTFTPEQVSVTLSGTKELIGKGMVPFTFELIQNGTVIAETQNDGVGNFSFVPLYYGKTGTHTYTIREKIPQGVDANNRFEGVTYDSTEYTAVVTVSGSQTDGALSAQVTYILNGEETDAAFFNRYTVDPVTDVVIEGNKTLSGGIRRLQANAFRFELLENGRVIQTVGNNVPVSDIEATFTFEPLTFEREGTYSYVVREHLPAGVDQNNPSAFGVEYDLREYAVNVVVTDQGDGTLHAQVQYPDGTPHFNNAYHVAPTYIEFSGKKHLLGDAISKYTGTSAFGFELYEAHHNHETKETVQGALIATATHNAEGEFRFDRTVPQLNFASIGGYHFIMKETVPANADPLMDYDLSVYHIEVAVVDDLQGGLKATASIRKVNEKGEASVYTDSVMLFENHFNVEPITVELGGKKNYNKTLSDGQFTFELYQGMEDANGEVIAIGDALLEAANQQDGTFLFQEKWVIDDLSGIQNKTAYMTFDKEGTYHFVVKEKLPEGVNSQNPHKNGITYDTKSYVVTVEVAKVTDQTGRDILVYEVIADQVRGGTLQITNLYDPADATVTFAGEKELKNKELLDDQFTFELYQVENGVESLKEAVRNKGKDFTFNLLTFEEEGVYTYRIKEKKGDDPKVTYDATVYEAVVTVTDENGVLKASVTVNGKADTAIRFTNLYDPDDAIVTLAGQKVLEGREQENGEFTFELYQVNGEEETLKESVTNQEGAITFTSLLFKEEGTFTFRVKEKAGNDATITYDARVYEVVVTVLNENGVLKATTAINGKADEKILFQNRYTEPPVEEPPVEEPPVETPPAQEPPAETPPAQEPPATPAIPQTPNTGDSSNLLLWIALLILSAGTFGTLVAAKKKIAG